MTGPRPGCEITTTPNRLGRVLAQTGNASCPGSLSFTYRPDGSELDHDAIGRSEPPWGLLGQPSGSGPGPCS